MSDNDWMLVEFEGTYTVANPSGVKGSKVLKPFHCKVEMAKSFLSGYGLRGVFSTYYMEQMRKLFPAMIDLYRFRMVEATELDGSKINDPKAMNHADLLGYISSREYQINTSFYDDQQLRHEIELYEKDKAGQQHLQANLEKIRGGKLAVSKQISDRGARIHVLPVASEEPDVSEGIRNAAISRAAAKVQPKAASKKPSDSQESDALLDSLTYESASA